MSLRSLRYGCGFGVQGRHGEALRHFPACNARLRVQGLRASGVRRLRLRV